MIVDLLLKRMATIILIIKTFWQLFDIMKLPGNRHLPELAGISSKFTNNRNF